MAMACPTAYRKITNFTGIGRGFNTGNKIGTFSSNGAGHIFNSIFTDQDLGFYVEFTEYEQDSYKQLQLHNLALRSNIFWEVSNNDSSEVFKIMAIPDLDITDQERFIEEYFALEKNSIKDFGI